MSATVEVFEVGRQQLWDMLAVCASVGDYVCVHTFGRLGWVNRNIICWRPENQDLDGLLASFEYLCERDIWALDEGYVKYAQDYEVWHVVDDAELWGDWEARVREAKIEAQRKASACRISLDDGYTYLDPVRDDVDLQELIVYLDSYPHKWDLITYYMDDETREFTHLTSSYTGMLPDEHTSMAMINACWLCDYLMNAEQDLIC